MSVPSLTTDQRGSITVEFVFVSFMMILFMTLLIGLAEYQAMSGKLDRTVYSVTGVLRERTQFYDANPSINQQQSDELFELAKKIIINTNPGFDVSTLSLTVEALHFSDNTKDEPAAPVIINHESFTIGSTQCIPEQSLKNMSQLSPKKEKGHAISLYQVTLCIPSPILFNRFIAIGSPIRQIKSSSVMFAR